MKCGSLRISEKQLMCRKNEQVILRCPDATKLNQAAVEMMFKVSVDSVQGPFKGKVKRTVVRGRRNNWKRATYVGCGRKSICCK